MLIASQFQAARSYFAVEAIGFFLKFWKKRLSEKASRMFFE